MFRRRKISDVRRLAASGIDWFAKIVVRGAIALFFVCVAVQLLHRFL